MKRIMLCFSAILVAHMSLAQSDSDTDFVSLFDGESLAGWMATKENPESFFVEEGMLVCQGGRAHLFYSGKVGDADFKDFELKLQAKTTNGSNSGVYFHTKYQEEGWPSIGFEAQVNSKHRDPKKTGSLYGIADIFVPEGEHDPFEAQIMENGEIFVYRTEAPSTDDEWFDYHIIVQGNTVTLKVDGETMIKWTQPEGWDKERRIGQGTIALQAHDPNSVTYYKDIEVKIAE